jgi:hypothetical protein
MITKWTIDLDCNDLVNLLSKRLREQGLYVHRSFDLRSAKEMLRDPKDCQCPNHGTSHCACQYIVLLIGMVNDRPISLIAHGHDGVTILSLDLSPPISVDPNLLLNIQRTIGATIRGTVQ